MSTVALTIGGMSCQHCVRAVREALEAVPGVTVSRVEIGSAEVSFDATQSSAEAIAAAVSDAGYDASASA
jgi:copper ion binding protein